VPLVLQGARPLAACHTAGMADGWEATLLDMAPTHGPAAPRMSDTGSPGADDTVVRDTGDADFDPNVIISGAPKALRGAAKVAGGSRTSAGRVLTSVAHVGGAMATGAAAGAALGSVVPGIGTAIGGAVGAVAGLIGGIVSLFSHHDNDPVADKLHGLAQRHPR